MKQLTRYFSGSDLFALAMLLYTLCLSWRFGFTVSLNPVYAWQVLLILYSSVVVLGLPYVCVFVLMEDRRLIREEKAGRPLLQTCRSLLSRYELGRHAWEIARTIMVLHLVLVLHSNLHRRIPRINPVLYDEAFRKLDTWLFFGTDPVWYMTLNPFFSSATFCAFIDKTYVLWYPVKFIVIAYFFFQPDLRELRRFATAFVLMWALHIPVVLLWPSLGPAFVNPEWFASLNLPEARELQRFLLQGYEQALRDPAALVRQFEGISGFYSLHVGLVGMYALFLWRHNRAVSALMWLFTLVIFIGSGLTGWHYLCDGIAGVAIGVFAFAVARWMYPLVSVQPGNAVESVLQ